MIFGMKVVCTNNKKPKYFLCLRRILFVFFVPHGCGQHFHAASEYSTAGISLKITSEVWFTKIIGTIKLASENE